MDGWTDGRKEGKKENLNAVQAKEPWKTQERKVLRPAI